MSQSPVSKVKRQRIWDRDGLRCRYCAVACVEGDSRLRPTVDHATPLSRGGSNDDDNLVTACFSCNSVKRHRTAEEYLIWFMDRFDSEETRL